MSKKRLANLLAGLHSKRNKKAISRMIHMMWTRTTELMVPVIMATTEAKAIMAMMEAMAIMVVTTEVMEVTVAVTVAVAATVVAMEAEAVID